MPLLSFKSKQIVSTSPGITSQSPPLMYAQPSSTLSEVDTVERTTPKIRLATHKAIPSDIFADITYYKEQKAKAAAAAKAKADANVDINQPESVVDSETNKDPEEREASFERPSTPPQGGRSIPWESYRDLPGDHPVFRYPDHVREKMYAKGIDPVVRAMSDRALYGKTYGEKTNPAKSFYKRSKGIMNSFGTMHMGGAY